MTELPRTPYKGLAPFGDSDLDARFFFGRDREAEIVTANLMASRLTVLYGPSGVGKSSLLRAAVARRLRALVPAGALAGETHAPLVGVVGGWRDDPVAAIAASIGAAPPGARVRLADAIAERADEAGTEVYLVLDQLEELFLYHRGKEARLAEELGEIVHRPDLLAHVLLGVRDDSLAELDAFKAWLPGLFANVLRLDHLDREAAASAIVGPLAEYARAGGAYVDAEPGLVEAVLDQVAAGRIERGRGGRAATPGRGEGKVEAPYLQLVMERLWEAEREAGSAVLRESTLAELGGAARIVEQHLERALGGLDARELDVTSTLFNHLVTPSGSKIAHAVDDLARYVGVTDRSLDDVLATLVAQRIVRPVPGRAGGPTRYEIFHDVLAAPVLDWREHHEAARALAHEQRRHRRAAALAAVALVALVCVSGLAVYAFAQRGEAREQARAADAQRALVEEQRVRADARALAATAATQLGIDPELALLLAVRAARQEPARGNHDVVRAALIESRVRRVARVGSPVAAVAVGAGDRVLVAAESGTTSLDEKLARRRPVDVRGRVLELRKGRLVTLVGSAIEVRDADTLALTQRIPLPLGRTVPIRDGEGFVIGSAVVPREPRYVALGPRSDFVALSSGNRFVTIVAVRSGTVRRVLEQPANVTALAYGPRARRLATGGADDRARLWNTMTWRQRTVLEGHEGDVVDIAFSPRATYVATASTDGTARVWDLASGERVSALVGHTNFVDNVVFSPDGETIATASGDRTARVWKTDTGATLAVLRGHTGPVTSVAFLDGATRAVTGSEDGTVRTWNALEQPRLRVLARLGAPVTRARFVDGRVEAVAGERAFLLDATTGRRLSTSRAVDFPAERSPDGATLSVDGSVAYVRRSGAAPVALSGHRRAITSARFSPDGRFVVTASRDRDARIWNARSGRLLHVLAAHFGTVSDAAFSPDGRWVVTAGPGKGALWDAENGVRLFYLSRHKGPLTTVFFDPTGRRVYTAGVDGTVRTYRCDVCAEGGELMRLAGERLAQTGRRPTADERARFLGRG